MPAPTGAICLSESSVMRWSRRQNLWLALGGSYRIRSLKAEHGRQATATGVALKTSAIAEKVI